MLESWFAWPTLTAAVLVLYHHLGYPLLLGLIARHRQSIRPPLPRRGWQAGVEDEQLPRIELIVPACDEADVLADKLRNLALLDYPDGRWQVRLLLDGCRDSSAAVARQTLSEPECASLPLQIHEFADNRGKVARLNQAIPASEADILLFSDASALLPVDSLLTVAAHLSEPGVGAVSLGYHLLEPGSDGETSYWAYQRRLKERESALGAVLGCHGSAYAVRRELVNALPPDTINDDFVLPMRIAAQGYQVRYEPRCQALELERSDPELEARRRRRIAAGNLQQIVYCLALLDPRLGWTAWMFASGKLLRVLMPVCLLLCWGGSLALAASHPLWLAAAAAQSLIYAWALGCTLGGHVPARRPARVLLYLIAGHWAGLLGLLRQLGGRHRGHWQRAKEITP